MRYYLETYGCQMNEADSEIVASICEEQGYTRTEEPKEADIILVNSCTVRENAETRAIARLSQFKGYKKNPDVILGLLGCVAERDRENLKNNYPFMDIVLGPDSYRKLETLITDKENKSDHNTTKELYEDISPKRGSKLNAWISIMRGCDQYCTYCIVPYTRGKERSRPLNEIRDRTKNIASKNIPQVTLLGQNVNSYKYNDNEFSDVLKTVAEIKDIKRIRFASPHPKNFDTKTLKIMRKYDNICNHIHLPLQSGSNKILKSMNRSYTREKYLSLAKEIKEILPDIAVTTDIIVGFPGESEEDFKQTLDVMKKVQFDNAFMFEYSPREGTYAAENLNDDVSNDVKNSRLQKVIDLQRKHTLIKNKNLINTRHQVLIEGSSKKDADEKVGRLETNKLVIIKSGSANKGEFKQVEITDAKGVSLFGRIVN